MLAARGGELDRERKVVQAPADRAHVVVDLDSAPGRGSARTEKLERGVVGERTKCVLVLVPELEASAACDEHDRAEADELAHDLRNSGEMLGVVENQQGALAQTPFEVLR